MRELGGRRAVERDAGVVQQAGQPVGQPAPNSARGAVSGLTIAISTVAFMS